MLTPIQFLGHEIEVTFDEPPTLAKVPGCPSAFTWRGQTFRVIESISEWRDFTRRGRAARNMRPERTAAATRRGSWGVGRFYFRVRVDGERFFELYYDRAPKDSRQRKGSWYLRSELSQDASPD